MLPLLFSLFLYSLCNAQQIIPLNTFKGGNVDTKINVPPPYSLYVSAHMDTSIVLNQIWVKTENNQVNSLQTLKNNRASADTNLLKPMIIQSTAYIAANLADTQMGALEGFLYITTTNQSNNEYFNVYDMTKSEMIRTLPMGCGHCTLVFLNTNYQMSVPYSSTFSSWIQEASSSVKMYKGVPLDEEELNSSQLFSNPVQTVRNVELFMPTVEKFSVSLNAFYLKVHGNVYFVVEPDYFDSNDIYATSGYHTTGFYMKSRVQPPKKATILCLRDTRFNGTTGANVVGSFISTTGSVYFSVNDGSITQGTSFTPATQILGWNMGHIGQNITISSDGSENGEFFLQYYVNQGEQISSTYAPGDPTTVAMDTTTSEGNTVNLLIGMIVMGLFSIFF